MALSDSALTTWAKLRAQLGLEDDSQQARGESAIESASAAVADYCDRQLHYVAAGVAYVPGFAGSLRLFVDRTPLLAVSSVVYDPLDTNSTIDPVTYRIEGSGKTGAIYRRSGWLFTGVYAGGAIQAFTNPSTEERSFKVTYTGGYVTRNQATALSLPMTLPLAIEDAATLLASMRHLYVARDTSIKAEKLGPWSAQYSAGGGSVSAQHPAVSELLRPYVRVIG